MFFEGETERKSIPSFIQRWLSVRLQEKVGVQPVRFNGWPDLFGDVQKKALMHLNGPRSNEIIGVVSLLDLYGPTFYPSHLSTKDEKYEWAKKSIEERVSHPKFRQFFAVHELEAWLLSNPDLFPKGIKDALGEASKDPENVNFITPPSKLLDNLFRQQIRKTYKKVSYGKQFFDKLDPEIAYGRCSKLKQMLD